MTLNYLSLLNLSAAVLFILSLRGLAFPLTAYRSNFWGIAGMVIAVSVSLLHQSHLPLIFAAITLGGLIGTFAAVKVKMTALPQTVAAFNGLGGLAAFLIAVCEHMTATGNLAENTLGAVIGIFTFSGSFIAFAKLQGIISSGRRIRSHIFNIILLSGIAVFYLFYLNEPSANNFYILSFLTLLLGITVTMRIGGADMPVIISVLNACSGLASVAIGFAIHNILLIITGALIGAGGCILSYVMSKAMNRPLLKILFSAEPATAASSDLKITKNAHSGSPADAAFMMENAGKIIIVPGYGMAVAQAQYALRDMALLLRDKYRVDVKFAIHPVAGRMPGHMNVLLAEANIPYEDIFALEDINREFEDADIAYVIGANDITNPLAKQDANSPIYGMPILEVEKAKTVFVVKRSLAAGYSGLDNPLFYADNTIMLYGDAKQVTAEIVKDLESAG